MNRNTKRTSVLRARRARSSDRRGAAVVELAVCLPVMVMLVLGSIEACNMIFLNQTLTITSYEGIRVAVREDSTNAEVTSRCDMVLEAREVVSPTITIDPANVAAVDRGQLITITVSAPCDANSVLPPWFYAGKTLTSTTVMVKE